MCVDSADGFPDALGRCTGGSRTPASTEKKVTSALTPRAELPGRVRDDLMPGMLCPVRVRLRTDRVLAATVSWLSRWGPAPEMHRRDVPR